MADATDGTGATDRVGTGIQALARRTAVATLLSCGSVVALAFFFPGIVGTIVGGSGMLAIALAFLGAVLVALSLQPIAGADGPTGGGAVWHGGTNALATRFLEEQEPAVLWPAAGVLVAFVVGFVAFPGTVRTVVDDAMLLVTTLLGWFLLAVVFGAFVACLVLLVGPWGRLRLGGPDAEPSYTLPAFFTMAFTAGIAAGAVFWAPAEALLHFGSVPPFVDAAPESRAAAVGGMQYALFHWGLSPWSAYAAVGVTIGYFVHERGAPLRVSALLVPFLGVDGLDGVPAKLVDVLAVFATVGGVATSIALVSSQFLSGIRYVWGVSFGPVDPPLFVAGLTVIFTVAAASGIVRGIRRIAVLTLAVLLVVVVLLVLQGPVGYLADFGAASVSAYLVEFVPMSLYLGEGTDWVANWTLFNWLWWLAWTPFVGLFVAALSRGRTIRSVVATTVFGTTAGTVCWFLLVGGTTLYVQQFGNANVRGVIAAFGSPAVAGYPVFASMTTDRLLVFCFLALTVTFMVTSADVSTLVVATLATRDDRPPSLATVGFWGAFHGVVAIVVLVFDGGEPLRTAAVVTGAPFAVIVVVGVVGLFRELRADRRVGWDDGPAAAARRLLPWRK